MCKVPADFPVKPLKPEDPATDKATCGTCGRSWDDAISTGWTPAPSGRCPFEYFHTNEKVKRTTIKPPSAEVLGRIEADPDFPRGYYARDLLYGRQNLSCSDLQGSAKKYSGSYARIRDRVLTVCHKYGVTDAYDKENRGRRVLTME